MSKLIKGWRTSMIRFDNDYTTGAHKRILSRLVETNDEQTSGYGTDPYCESAKKLIQQACAAPTADVHFLVGGTQTNKTVISSILRPHQGVIAAESGHIATNETGAIEATGHKVLTVPSKDGKIRAEQVEDMMKAHLDNPGNIHTVQPGMVYISHPTEVGTLYTLDELAALHGVCNFYGLPLFLDGARLGYGLAAEGTDVTLPHIAELCDVFYIGGTKVGAMFGEAVVITSNRYKNDFRYMMKQGGALLAKGRLLGIQFETLFEDMLYMDIAKHAVELAMLIREAFTLKGFTLRYDSLTNQQFIILPNEVYEHLSKSYIFSKWETIGEHHTVIRICTSWATSRESVAQLVKDIMHLKTSHYTHSNDERTFH